MYNTCLYIQYNVDKVFWFLHVHFTCMYMSLSTQDCFSNPWLPSCCHGKTNQANKCAYYHGNNVLPWYQHVTMVTMLLPQGVSMLPWQQCCYHGISIMQHVTMHGSDICEQRIWGLAQHLACFHGRTVVCSGERLRLSLVPILVLLVTMTWYKHTVFHYVC